MTPGAPRQREAGHIRVRAHFVKSKTIVLSVRLTHTLRSFILHDLCTGLDVPGMEPLDYSVMDAKPWEELIHRFRPKAVILCTASCPSLMRALLEGQIPTLAVCAMAVTNCVTDNMTDRHHDD